MFLQQELLSTFYFVHQLVLTAISLYCIEAVQQLVCPSTSLYRNSTSMCHKMDLLNFMFYWNVDVEEDEPHERRTYQMAEVRGRISFRLLLTGTFTLNIIIPQMFTILRFCVPMDFPPH